jgi:tetratricopeptide (TPR) repeat protein
MKGSALPFAKRLFSPRGFLMLGILFSLASASARSETVDLAATSHRAKQAMLENHFEEASALYAELVRVAPNDPGFRLNWGLALHSAGHYQEAVEQFQIYLKRRPDNAPAWLLSGLDWMKLDEPSRAVPALEHASRADPNNKLAHVELAQALLAVNRPDEALSHLQDAKRLDPADPEVWQGLGLAYNALSRQAFDQLENVAPESPFHETLLARSLVERNQFLMAFSLFKQAHEKDPELRAASEGLAKVYQKTGHPDWAAKINDELDRLPLPDCSVRRFECEIRAGNYDDVVREAGPLKTPAAYYWTSLAWSDLSLQAFDHLEQMPPSVAIHDLLAEAYRIQGKYEMAIGEWREALKLAPDDRGQKEGLARALWLNKDYQEARSALEELLRGDPESPQLNYELGDATLRLGNPQEAVPYLEKAVKFSPNSKIARDTLGLAYTKVNQTEKAIPQFRAALGLDDEGTVEYHLAQAYKQIGCNDLAQEYIVKFERASKAVHARQPQNIEDFQITPP